jgi:uncharacterized integral membrane protein
MADAKMQPGTGKEPAPRDRKRDARIGLIVAAAVLLVWFAIDNHRSVSIHFWVHTSKAPLIVVIVIAAVLGALIGLFVQRRRKSSGPPTQD